MPSGPCKEGEGTERRMTVGSVVPAQGSSIPAASHMYVNTNPQPPERMTFEQFAYWLQGFFELSGTHALTERHVRIINDHLAKVFNKQTPNYTFTGPGIGGGPVPVPYIIPQAPLPNGTGIAIC